MQTLRYHQHLQVVSKKEETADQAIKQAGHATPNELSTHIGTQIYIHHAQACALDTLAPHSCPKFLLVPKSLAFGIL